MMGDNKAEKTEAETHIATLEFVAKRDKLVYGSLLPSAAKWALAEIERLTQENASKDVKIAAVLKTVLHINKIT